MEQVENIALLSVIDIAKTIGHTRVGVIDTAADMRIEMLRNREHAERAGGDTGAGQLRGALKTTIQRAGEQDGRVVRRGIDVSAADRARHAIEQLAEIDIAEF